MKRANAAKARDKLRTLIASHEAIEALDNVIDCLASSEPGASKPTAKFHRKISAQLKRIKKHNQNRPNAPSRLEWFCEILQRKMARANQMISWRNASENFHSTDRWILRVRDDLCALLYRLQHPHFEVYEERELLSFDQDYSFGAYR